MRVKLAPPSDATYEQQQADAYQRRQGKAVIGVIDGNLSANPDTYQRVRHRLDTLLP